MPMRLTWSQVQSAETGSPKEQREGGDTTRHQMQSETNMRIGEVKMQEQEINFRQQKYSKDRLRKYFDGTGWNDVGEDGHRLPQGRQGTQAAFARPFPSASPALEPSSEAQGLPGSIYERSHRPLSLCFPGT